MKGRSLPLFGALLAGLLLVAAGCAENEANSAPPPASPEDMVAAPVGSPDGGGAGGGLQATGDMESAGEYKPTGGGRVGSSLNK